MQRTSKLKQLATRLLTTTCLTAAASVAAFAGTVTEPVGGFGNTFPGTLLPAGTTQVSGITTLNNGSNDFFELQGLPGGASLSSISFHFVNNSAAIPFGVVLLTDTNTVVTALHTIGTLSSYDPIGTIPLDGNLVVDMQPGNEGGSAYVLTLNTSVPEPGTLAALGLGLAGLGAAGLRRRLRKS
jgi:PEP-CTERM motif